MPTGSIVLALVSLAGVLALVLLAGRAVRAGGWAPRLAHAGTGHLALVQTLPLDARRRLHLIRCEGRHLLLLIGGPTDQVAGWLPPFPVEGEQGEGEPPAP